jgi:hypothetical protein
VHPQLFVGVHLANVERLRRLLRSVVQRIPLQVESGQTR